jgi:hypothetical protein
MTSSLGAVARTCDPRTLHFRAWNRNVLVARQRLGRKRAHTQFDRTASAESFIARAGRPPNFNNGSFDFDSLDIDEEALELVQSAVPALFGLLAFGFLYPLGGIPLPGALVVGVGATLGLSLSSGYLAKVERKLGVSTGQSVLAIVGVVFAIFAVPAVLRFGFFLLAIGAAANLLTTLVNPGGTTGMPDGFDGLNSSPFAKTPTGRNPGGMGSGMGSGMRSGMGGGMRSGMGGARRDTGTTIDVEWESLDD